jgi:hypothetical protein
VTTLQLRRELTETEAAVMDVERLTLTLDTTKDRLERAIRRAQRAAIADFLAGGPGRLAVTAEMIRILYALHAAGQVNARHELRRLGIQPEPALRGYVAVEDPDPEDLSPGWVQRVLRLLQPELQRLATRIRVRLHTDPEIGSVDVTIGQAATSAVQRAAIRRLSRVPGARAAAAAVVTTAHNAGLESVYRAQDQTLFAGWVISAVLDPATCGPCSADDGEEFDTLDAAMGVMPNMGPNPRCQGGSRCRCRLVPTGLAAAA